MKTYSVENIEVVMIIVREFLKMSFAVAIGICSISLQMNAHDSIALLDQFQEVDPVEAEIQFVKSALAEFGFFPKSKEVFVFRGDKRSPDELRKVGGFFRKTFGDTTKIPSYRVDGAVRNMIGCSTDFNMAAGFAKYSADVIRRLVEVSDSGWVYAIFLPSNSYYNPTTDYPYAFLSDWGKELDAILIPFEHIIGAVQVKSSVNACIHSYMTRIPQRLHCVRGCNAAYVDQIELEVCDLWINEGISSSVNTVEKERIKQKLEEMKLKGTYTVQTKDENSKRAQRITQNYDAYFQLCAPYPVPDKDLTARLTPEPVIEYIESIL